ncbi:MAG: hypothetical protein ACI3VG_01930 [Oscillospiraceae bacterium]
MTFQNAATTVAAFILYFVRKVLEKAGRKILIKNIQVVSGTKAGKKKKDRSKSCLFYMVEISGIEPLTS